MILVAYLTPSRAGPGIFLKKVGVAVMDEIPEAAGCGWSWEENKLFELALAVVDEEDPYRWEMVAGMVVGKSAEEVEKHYSSLLEDLLFIESGALDHKLGEFQPCLKFQYTCSRYWTEEDDKLLVELDLN